MVLSGSLQNPRAFQLQHPATQQNPQTCPGTLPARSLKLSPRLKFPGAPPELRLKINGDLADLPRCRFRQFRCAADRSSLPIGALMALKRSRLREANLEHQTIEGARSGGELSLSAQWKDSVLDLRALQHADAGTLLHGFCRRTRRSMNLKFAAAPQLEATGRIIAQASPVQYNVTGAVQIGKFSFRGMDFDAFSTDFASSNGKIFLQRCKAPCRRRANRRQSASWRRMISGFA